MPVVDAKASIEDSNFHTATTTDELIARLIRHREAPRNERSPEVGMAPYAYACLKEEGSVLSLHIRLYSLAMLQSS